MPIGSREAAIGPFRAVPRTDTIVRMDAQLGPGRAAGTDLAMLDDCPMTEECPAWDRDARACLVAPGDCEFEAAFDADGRSGALDAPPGGLPAVGR